MGKTYKSGIGTAKERRSPIAPTMAGGMPQGVVGQLGRTPERGQLVKKGTSKGGEPGGPGTKTHRIQSYERQGARQRIQPRMGYQNQPEASATQANGRTVKSFPKMQDAWGGGQFWDASRGGL